MSSKNAGGGTYISWEEIHGERVGFIRSCETGRIGSLGEVEEAVRFRLGQIGDDLDPEVPADLRLMGEADALRWILRVIEGPERA